MATTKYLINMNEVLAIFVRRTSAWNKLKGHSRNMLCSKSRQIHENMERARDIYAIELSGQDIFCYLTSTASDGFYICSCMLGLGHAPIAYLEQMRLLFSAIAVGKTDGHPAAFGADILSLKPITSCRISGERYSQLTESNREIAGGDRQAHTPQTSAAKLW